MCQVPVPAVFTTTSESPASSSLRSRTTPAMAERQMLPRQTSAIEYLPDRGSRAGGRATNCSAPVARLDEGPPLRRRVVARQGHAHDPADHGDDDRAEHRRPEPVYPELQPH